MNRNLAPSLAAILTSTLLAAPAGAERGAPFDSVRLTPPERPAGDGGVAGLLVEDFESGFPVGLLDGINGWQAGDFGGNMYVTDTGLIASEGSFAACHVSDGTSLGGFELDSPDFAPTFGSVSADVRITGQGSLYQFVVLDTANLFFITRIQFETDGRITFGQTDPAPGIDPFVYFDTGATWTVNVPVRLCVANDPDGQIRVYVDGDLALLGRSAAAVAFDSGDTPTAPAGIGRIMTFTDNDGEGDVSDPGTPGNPFDDVPLLTGDNYVIDNVGGDVCGAPDCPGDANGDLVVDIDDVVTIVLDFGCLDPPGPCVGDVDGSGETTIDDVIMAVLNFGLVCLPTGFSNDQCVDRFDVFFGGSTTFDSGDDLDGGPPACGSNFTTDVWFNFYVTQSGLVKIDTIGSTYNTVLEVYDTDACPALSQNLLACDDDGALSSSSPIPEDPANFDSEVSLFGTAGQRFKIRVIGSNAPTGPALGGGPGGSGTGVLNIEVTVDVDPPPANDDCADAQMITDLPASIPGQIESATNDPLDVIPCGDPVVFSTGPGVWYRVLGTGETMSASLCNTARPFNSVLYVYCGDTTNCRSELPPTLCPFIDGTLECGDANDNGCGPLSEVVWCSAANQPYMIYVGGFTANDTGEFLLRVMSDGSACAPALSCQSIPIDIFPVDCAGAVPITQGTTSYTNLFETTDGPAHPQCEEFVDNGETTEDLWYRYTATGSPGSDQVLLVTTCEELAGSADHDTDLVLYEGTSCDEADLLANIIACNDDDVLNPCGTNAGGERSTIIVPVTPGTEYLIRLGSHNTGDTGCGTLLVEQFETTGTLCDAAVPIDADGSTVTVDTSEGMFNPLETCDNAAPFDAPGIWFTTVGDGREYTITTCSLDPVFWDTRLTVYCGDCFNQDCVGETDDNALACGPNETLTWCTFPGFEYTIFVSGVGGAAGTVSVTLDAGPVCADPACLPPDECGDGNGLYRPRTLPDGGWTFLISDVNIDLLVFDDLGAFDGVIDAIRWWGFTGRFVLGGGFAACNDTAIDFEITVYGDAGGLPDPTNSAVIHRTTVDGPPAEAMSDVYESGSGVQYQERQWTVALDQPFDLAGTLGPQPRYYVSIQDTDGDICLFLWAGSPVGNAQSWVLDQDLQDNPDQTITPDMISSFGDPDRAICINPTL